MNLNSTFIIQCLVFFGLALFTMKFVWPPLIKALDDRRTKIADGLAAAEKGNQSLKSAEVKIASLEAEARQRAADIVAQTEKRAQGMIDEAKGQAKLEADRLIASAQAEARQTVERARVELREQVAALVVAGAEQILKKEINPQAHAELLAQFKSKL